MMDSKALPSRCLVDTGVLIRALRQLQDDRTEDSEAFFDAMLYAGNTMFIAAPTLAEVLRQKPETDVPATRNVRVVPFDRQAAELLAEKLPIATQQAQAAAAGLSRSYIKFDAMIVACAKRWDAGVIVSLDGDHRRLAPMVGLQCSSPASFRARQLVLAAIDGGKTGKK